MQVCAWEGLVTVHARARKMDFFSVIGAESTQLGGMGWGGGGRGDGEEGDRWFLLDIEIVG